MKGCIKFPRVLELALVFGIAGALAPPGLGEQSSVANGSADSFAVAVKGPTVFNVLFDNYGNIVGPNPNFRGNCGSPLGLCVQCDVHSVDTDEIIGTMTVAAYSIPATLGDSFTLQVARKFELPGGTITTPVSTDYHSRTSDPPKHGGTEAFFVGYHENGAIATGTGRFAHATITTEMRGRLEAVNAASTGLLPIWFSHLFLIKVTR